MLEKLTVGDFEAQVGCLFRVDTAEADEALVLELIEASALGEGGNGPRQQPFSLVFRGPRGAYLPQKIYALSNDEMGTLEIFLVPVRPDEQGMRMQAIFN